MNYFDTVSSRLCDEYSLSVLSIISTFCIFLRLEEDKKWKHSLLIRLIVYKLKSYWSMKKC